MEFGGTICSESGRSLPKVTQSSIVSTAIMNSLLWDSERLAVTTNFPYRGTSVSASNVMKPAECRALYHTGSSARDNTVRPAETLTPVAESLKKKKVIHTLHFCTETASHADNSWELNTAAYFKAELENTAAE